MAERDKAREWARYTGDTDDWLYFKSLRNKCTGLQRKGKIEFNKKLYDKIEDTKNTAELFSTIKTLLGWKNAGPPNGFLVDGVYVTKGNS